MYVFHFLRSGHTSIPEEGPCLDGEAMSALSVEEAELSQGVERKPQGNWPQGMWRIGQTCVSGTHISHTTGLFSHLLQIQPFS